jgi:hypothetical protein
MTITTTADLVAEAADKVRSNPHVLAADGVAARLADLLDGIAAFARQPGVRGPQAPVLDLCEAILREVP